MTAGDVKMPSTYAQLLGTEGTNWREIGCNANGMLYTHPWSKFGIVQDLTLGDTDKTFTIPANKLWIIRWISVRLTTTATANFREMAITIIDAAAVVIGRLGSGNAFLPSTTNHILWTGPMSLAQKTQQEITHSPMPSPFILPAGYQLQVLDFAAIDPTNDDMLVTIGRQEIDDS